MTMYIGLAIAVIALLVLTYLNTSVFGAEPLEDDLKHSIQFKNGVFTNQSPTAVMRKDASYLSLIKDLASKPKNNTPNRALEVVKTDLKNLPIEPTIIWFGHSSYLLNIDGKKILVDPVFHNASPVSFFGKAYDYTYNYQIEDLPEIDIVLITHDHYDHLDEKAIKKLIPKTKHFVTSLGVDAHLKHWGISAENISVLDWYQSTALAHLTFTAAPARHFSGRKFKRGNTLWSSFILNTNDYKIYLGGDSGYDAHFKEIGEKFGPFDLSILECGQYGKDWPHIHMTPEETVKAALDLKAKKLLPVHWAKFSLAFHPWTEPVERALIASESTDLTVFTPQIGELLNFNEENHTQKWWTKYDVV
jgi:L-ascorbate metabolism protein UlaG (beta-lactamase superfamily)